MAIGGFFHYNPQKWLLLVQLSLLLVFMAGSFAIAESSSNLGESFFPPHSFLPCFMLIHKLMEIESAFFQQ